MVKEDENKKKMFGFVKRLKENTRRSQLRSTGQENSSDANQTAVAQATDESQAESTAPQINLQTPKDTNQPTPTDGTKITQTNELGENNCSICLRENNVSMI